MGLLLNLSGGPVGRSVRGGQSDSPDMYCIVQEVEAGVFCRNVAEISDKVLRESSMVFWARLRGPMHRPWE